MRRPRPRNGTVRRGRRTTTAIGCASYRRLLVVALGQLKRMRAVATALPPGPLRLEQEAINATAEQEVKYLQGQTTILKNMADACTFADDTWDPAAFFAMVRR